MLFQCVPDDPLVKQLIHQCSGTPIGAHTHSTDTFRCSLLVAMAVTAGNSRLVRTGHADSDATRGS